MPTRNRRCFVDSPETISTGATRFPNRVFTPSERQTLASFDRYSDPLFSNCGLSPLP